MTKNTTTKQEVLSEIGATFENLGKLVQSLTAFEGEGTTTASKKATKEVAPVVKDTEEVEGYTYEELNELQIGELKKLADENDIEYAKSVKKQPLIKLILASLEEGAEEEDEDEGEDEGEEAITVVETEDGDVDLSELNVAKLKKFAKEYDLALESKDKDGIIAEIVEFFNEEDEDDSDDTEDGEEEIDVDELDLDELKELANEYEIVIPKKKKGQKADAYLEAVREVVREELEGEDGDEDEDDSEEGDIAEEYGLNDMDTEELAEILESYELSTKGKKQALIDRIVKGVEDGTIEFDEEEGE